jgi:hypothetical protein
MNLSSLKKAPLKSRVPVIAGVVLVFGLFGLVMLTQQTQDIRSKAGTGGTGNCATVNPSSGEALTSDNCTIQSGFNGSIFGSNNTIMGGLGGEAPNITGNGNLIMGGSNGSIFGDGNEICGGLNGGITGNNNVIHGPVGGAINGTGNIINYSGPCGIIRQPTQPPTVPPSLPPTVPPTQPHGTCNDNIDNNQNELIDEGDPICHTDGNQNNPNSYDPTRNEVYPPSQPPSVPPTVPPTSPPTVGPTISVPPGNTSVKLNLLLHGLGKGGDSANPNSGGNPTPLHPQRTATVEVYNSQNQLILTKEGGITFNATNGNFTGQVDLGAGFVSGAYTVKVKTTQFLKTLVPGIQNISQGVANQLPATVMVNGDVNGDNTLNILDYNILMGCYSDFLPPVSCTEANKLLSDLDDDGDVNQYDYNLFLREITNRQGQ